MVQINPANVLNMLIVLFQILNIPQTIINNREIELHDTIKSIIKNAMDDILFVMQIDTTLEFENWNSFPETEIIADDEIEELEENDEDERKDDCTKENKIVNYDYKKSC